uniref:Uncharacterized protein n=1 Tax=Solanum lycopersicum TaxID=4081 RepID=A0A3Q7I1X4_SOLLC
MIFCISILCSNFGNLHQQHETPQFVHHNFGVELIKDIIPLSKAFKKQYFCLPQVIFDYW